MSKSTFLIRWIAALVMLGVGLSLSCGHDPQLIRIAVSPQNITVAGTPAIIYTAVGYYKGSQTTKDLTSQVTWKASTPSIAAFSDTTHPNYLIPTGTGCGANLGVTAAIYKNPTNPTSGQAVLGSATVNVECGTPVDFSLSANPTTVTVSAGNTASYTISVLVKSGSPTVNLQVTSGLPPGVSASFNPPSVTGTSFSTLTITIGPGIAPGTYHPKITGNDESGSLGLPLTLTVT
jgi:hypothetical protein